MISNKIKKEMLVKELEPIGNHICDLMDKLHTNNLTASEYSQTMAEYNIWMRRYDKIDTEILVLEVSPSKRTGVTERNLKSKLVQTL